MRKQVNKDLVANHPFKQQSALLLVWFISNTYVPVVNNLLNVSFV